MESVKVLIPAKVVENFTLCGGKLLPRMQEQTTDEAD
jgi:hypothetical protein